jgi:hypothetical protein
MKQGRNCDPLLTREICGAGSRLSALLWSPSISDSAILASGWWGSRTVTATASAQFQAILVQHLIEQNPPPGGFFFGQKYYPLRRRETKRQFIKVLAGLPMRVLMTRCSAKRAVNLGSTARIDEPCFILRRRSREGLRYEDCDWRLRCRRRIDGTGFKFMVIVSLDC